MLTHGNGPQVGLLSLQASAYPDVPPYPLDVLGAESEGMIGYVLEQELGNRLPGRAAVTVLTQVVVDPEDPAFQNPTKPIGPVYTEEQARRLEAERGWAIAPDGGHFRRVVASPQPLRIVEISAIRMLVDAGAIVVCTGGGGIPVTVNGAGTLRGVEAVIDKDLAGELLARSLDADFLLMLTDVPAVLRDWGGPLERPISRATPTELRVDAVRERVDGAEGRRGVPLRGGDREPGGDRRARGRLAHRGGSGRDHGRPGRIGMTSGGS